MSEATRQLIDHVQSVAGLPIAPEKTQVLASKPGALKKLGSKLGMTTVRAARNLGVDFACGRRVAKKVLHKRIAGALSRKARFRRLAAAGGKKRSLHRLVATGIHPAVLFGSSVTGLYEVELLRVRRASRALASPGSSKRSLNLDFMLLPSVSDPAFIVNRSPIVAWAVAV